MEELITGAVMSIVTGFVLWLLLPRGVVLTKAPLTHNPFTGEEMYDSWRITNDSALPVRIVSVAYYGADTMEHPDGPWVELTEDLDDRRGLSLHLDDEVPEIARLDASKPWSKVKVPPEDTLTVSVRNLTDLRIKYRRAGWSGFAERREVWIRGGM